MSSKSITKPKRSKRNKKFKTFTDPRDDEHFNLKPSNLEQTSSKRMQEFEQQKAASKTLVSRKRKKNKFNLEFVEQDQPRWKKKKGESDDHFLRRVDRDTHNYVQKTQFENKFKIDKKPDILNEDSLQKNPKKNLKGSRKMKEKKEKLRMRKNEKINSKTDEFKKLKDEVKFGEVVLAPPSLNKAIKTKNSNLLLAKKFATKGDKSKETKEAKASGLSVEMLEERRKVIEFYRMNKAKRQAERQLENTF